MASFRWVESASSSPRSVSLLSTDGGATWLQLPGELRTGALATNNGVRYAVVYDTTRINDYGSIATISNMGGALSVRLTSYQPLVPNVFIVSLWMHPPEPVMFVADTGGTFWRSDDAGAHWAALSLPRRMLVQQGRWMERQRQWYFCTGSESVVCSTDGGKTWQLGVGYGGATGCTLGGILADGSLLAACENTTPTAQLGWYALMWLAPGTTIWRQIGTVPSYQFTLTATGQIWGVDMPGASVAPGRSLFVATLMQQA